MASSAVGFDPRRVPWAVVVAEAGDDVRGEFDSAARRAQPELLGVAAKLLEHRQVLCRVRHRHPTVGPELVERRNGTAETRPPLLVEMFQPLRVASGPR